MKTYHKFGDDYIEFDPTNEAESEAINSVGLKFVLIWIGLMLVALFGFGC